VVIRKASKINGYRDPISSRFYYKTKDLVRANWVRVQVPPTAFL